MLFRRLVPMIPAALLPWAGCTSLTLDSGEQQQELRSFAGNDAEARRQAEEISLQHLLDRQPELLSGVDEVWAKRVHIDEFGQAHTRIEQTKGGVPVYGAQGIVHLDADGSFKSLTDNFVRDINVNTTPRLREGKAIEIAINAAGGQSRITGTPRAELNIVRHNGVDRLAYVVQLESFLPDRDPSMPQLFVDAKTGEIFRQLEGLVTIKNRKTYNANNRTSLPGTLVRSEGQGPVADAVLNQAHDNAGFTYDFYFNKFGRDSYDGAGATITSTVHYSRNYVNAFWNSTQMVYGDGDGSQSGPLTVLDVVAHELTHAVTEKESGLVYSNESGALNEALSDIFGAAIEAYRDGAVSTNTWKVGEECWTPATAGDALRYMNDPVAAGDYDYWPTRYTGTSDNGGVHWNSGIANLAFYLAVNGGTHPRGKTSIVVPALDPNNALNSLNTAAAIFYRAQTVYLTPSSTFSDAYAATKQAALDLYGSNAATSISAAWDAVGVPKPPTWVAFFTQSNLSASRNAQKSYTHVTPSGALRLKFQLSGGTGDADLYVRYGSAPTTATYDCRSAGATSDEACVINNARQGTYYVMINAYSAYSGVTYTVSSSVD